MKLDDPSLFREAALIGGEWIQADDGSTETVTNPATGEIIGRVPALGAAETSRAIASAEKAFKAWSALTAAERAKPLRRLFELMLENRSDLAKILTAEQGKPLTEAAGEINYAASFLEWYAEEGKRVYGDVIPTNNVNRRILVFKQPIGVFGAITPWNFPSAMITRKAGPAWAAGCTGVVRPASNTPFSALALGVLAERAGLPAGVCNIVTGPPEEIAAELCENPIVRKISFTGSTRVGALLLKQCAPTIKKTSMELGGNAPFIVFDDADIEKAVDGAIAAKYRNAGQTCVCANRLLVQAGIYDQFAQRLAEKAAALKIGPGVNEGVQVGPMIDHKAVEKTQAHIADALERGATLKIGGKPHRLGGHFFEPTVLVDVPREALCFREETFGPVAPLFKFETEEDAISLANDSEFGLAAYFYTADLARAFRVAEALETGIVGINEGLISTEVAPFGGVKSSGLGREGSKYGIDDYLEIKYVGIAGILS
ncbi:NAD-dependent succinate-semialdehyde dehydrogenase [Sphingobium sp. H33]|uniref:NAD-dependent succinate-semialdehyde dehydrogenase n=1 Tax=Sphingobium nicotianae TaxID=2782607 RepID=A0A9X1D9S6_9SPHN|nr:NAD-dependent succinate-semialdehyde dehydrogenase [Sphingobium nicotianae]